MLQHWIAITVVKDAGAGLGKELLSDCDREPPIMVDGVGAMPREQLHDVLGSWTILRMHDHDGVPLGRFLFELPGSLILIRSQKSKKLLKGAAVPLDSAHRCQEPRAIKEVDVSLGNPRLLQLFNRALRVGAVMDHSENITGRVELPEHRWGVLRRLHGILVGMWAMLLVGMV
jgi:hypothetical protein